MGLLDWHLEALQADPSSQVISKASAKIARIALSLCILFERMILRTRLGCRNYEVNEYQITESNPITMQLSGKCISSGENRKVKKYL
jgi:hypothetical protein